jgi:threonine/homoserine/homoserine lactone efflux protein
MVDIILFLKSLIIGVTIAAPVGPVGILCIQRTLTYGGRTGFVSGLGAATADALYGLVAVMGLTIVSDFLLDYQFWIQLWGGVFLFLLGWKTFTSQPATFKTGKSQATSSLKGFFSVFLLTVTNPMTILAFIAIFGVFRVTGSDGGVVSALIVVLGVFGGSAFWWGTVAMVGGWLSSRIESDSLTMINRVAGIIITIFSSYILIDLI